MSKADIKAIKAAKRLRKYCKGQYRDCNECVFVMADGDCRICCTYPNKWVD